MIPILYQTVTEGTVPTNYGIGALTDCISCTVTEERNGGYELAMTYAVEGIHASDIEPNRFILAKPNYTDDPQIFRIYKVGKTINGAFTVNAQHISYDLSGKVISSGTASSAVAACALLQAKAGSFTINTDKTVSAAFSITAPSSVRSWFGGKQGSLLDIYGGEWKYDNYTASLKQARGSDRGVEIRYAKNLTQLSQLLDMSNLCTGVIPFYIDQDGNKTVGTKVSTGLSLDVDRDIAVDFSQDVDPKSGTAIATQLANLASAYITNTNLTSITNSITLDFVQSGKLTERVDLCDTVHIFFEALGISAAAKCVKTVWNVLEERYTSTAFGDARTNICDTIASAQKQLQETPSTSFMAEAIARATELITGNLGGNVVIHKNSEGRPFEILIMDTDDINTAVKLWRWGLGGFGYSKTGYDGPFGTAITMNGQIVADYIATGTLDASKISVQHLSANSIDAGTLDASKITVKNLSASSINTGTLDGTKASITNINASNINTGTLNANLIKAGTISDMQGNSSINMTNGKAVLNNLDAKSSFHLIDASNRTRASIAYSTNENSGIWLYNAAGSDVAAAMVVTSTGGSLALRTLDGTVKARMDVYAPYGSTLGGALNLYNYSGVNAVALYCNSDNAGYFMLRNASNAGTIYGNAHTGNLTCTSLTQTSSRKVKENIKPIEDAEKILELEAVSFDYKDKARGTDKRGFIAEDVAKILPNLVTPETEDSPACLDYIEMIPYLQAVIKKQDERIKALEQRLEVLENKLKEV